MSSLSPSMPEIHDNPPDLAFHVLGLQVCAAVPGSELPCGRVGWVCLPTDLHVETGDGCCVSSSVIFHFTSSDVPHWACFNEVGWSSTSQDTRKSHETVPWFYIGAGDLNSSPLAFTASPVHGVSSPVPIIKYLIIVSIWDAGILPHTWPRDQSSQGN